MNNQDLTPQLPAGAHTLIERYAPEFREAELTHCAIHPDHDSIYNNQDQGDAMLAASMEEIGQVQLVICWMLADGMLQIINGARIWRAAKSLGWRAISVAVLTHITEDEVLPLMHSLNSHSRRFSYKIAAKKLTSTEENAKRLIRENRDGNNENADLTVRQYTANMLGFKSERHVSDMKHIINHPDCNVLLEMMDQGRLKLNKAVKIAKGSIDIPKVKEKQRKGNIQVYTCDDCPRRAEFLRKLEEGDNENTGNGDEGAATVVVTPDAPVTPVPVAAANTIKKEVGNE